VAADSLGMLHQASAAGCFEIVAVVSQPPAPAGRKKKLQASPVHELAEKLNLPLMVPESAKDPVFLEALESLQVDLCVTAAYGNFLPKKFLSIPKFGTVNVHPSLLPLYRGAAPVQRCLEKGDAATGVSVAFTVLKMDAGPIIQQLPYPLTGDEKAPKVLSDCFRIGTQALIDLLPAIFDSTVQTTEQNAADATAADKLSASDAVVDFATMGAAVIHNKARGYAEWPGIVGYFMVGGEAVEAEKIKIITTHVLTADGEGGEGGEGDGGGGGEGSRDVVLLKGCEVKNYSKKMDLLRVVCGDGSVLGVSEVQPPSKKVMGVKDFLNGLRGDTAIRWAPIPISTPTPDMGPIPVCAPAPASAA
jgi:methionyl-tRNA formyltransferase